MVRNERIWRWFDAGNVVDAILGRGPFLIRGVTWHDEHDRILVLSQLLSWASQGEHGRLAEDGLVDAVCVAAQPGTGDGLDIVRSYLLVLPDSQEARPADPRQLYELALASGERPSPDIEDLLIEAERDSTLPGDIPGH